MRKRRSPGVQPKKNPASFETGFSEPYGGCSDVEVMARFELANDGFAARPSTTQNPSVFKAFRATRFRLTIALTTAPCITDPEEYLRTVTQYKSMD